VSSAGALPIKVNKHTAWATSRTIKLIIMPNGKKKKGHKMATHKRKKRLRKNRHKSK